VKAMDAMRCSVTADAMAGDGCSGSWSWVRGYVGAWVQYCKIDRLLA
jgi:hypothetical protein